MSLEDHPWYPSTPGQSAAVFTLTLLLLLNTTVLLLVLTGELPFNRSPQPVATAQASDRSAAPVQPTQAMPVRAVASRVTVQRDPAPQVDPAEPVVTPAPVIKPAVVIHAAHDPASVVVTEAQQASDEPVATPQAEPTESPVRFFGIEIE